MCWSADENDLPENRKNIHDGYTPAQAILRELHPPIPPSANPDWNGEVCGFEVINYATVYAESRSMVEDPPRQTAVSKSYATGPRVDSRTERLRRKNEREKGQIRKTAKSG